MSTKSVNATLSSSLICISNSNQLNLSKFYQTFIKCFRARKTGHQTFSCIFVAGPHWWAGSGPRARG